MVNKSIFRAGTDKGNCKNPVTDTTGININFTADLETKRADLLVDHTVYKKGISLTADVDLKNGSAKYEAASTDIKTPLKININIDHAEKIATWDWNKASRHVATVSRLPGQ